MGQNLKLRKGTQNLTGLVCGKLEVLGPSHRDDKNIFWECECECGNIKHYTRCNLLDGKLKSCGCWKEENKAGIHKNWKGRGQMSASFVGKIKTHAKVRKIEFNLDIDYLWNLFKQQSGLCAYSGQKLVFSKNDTDFGHGKTTASVDRIDSSKGYIEGNVQWVHKDVNFMKYQFSHEHFITMCKTIVENLERATACVY